MTALDNSQPLIYDKYISPTFLSSYNDASCFLEVRPYASFPDSWQLRYLLQAFSRRKTLASFLACTDTTTMMSIRVYMYVTTHMAHSHATPQATRALVCMWFILMATLFIAMYKSSNSKIIFFRFSSNVLGSLQNYGRCVFGGVWH
jgi:hypothetical protein